MVDNSPWALILRSLLMAMGIGIDKSEGAGFGFLVAAAWIPVEAILLAWVGATPGKWLFNIRLSSSDGTPLRVGRLFQRARGVWIYGLGLGLLVFPLIMMIYSYFELKKHNATTWDRSCEIEVQHRQLNGVRKVIIVSLCALLTLLTLVAILPTVTQT
jgi:uncharacterized RDD family membrane protein YckC